MALYDDPFRQMERDMFRAEQREKEAQEKARLEKMELIERVRLLEEEIKTLKHHISFLFNQEEPHY
jgi:hypothetical protein